MNIGDIVTRVPTVDSCCGLEVTAMPGRVVYIHPRERFYVLEFQDKIHGERWREAFYFIAPPKRDRRKP